MIFIIIITLFVPLSSSQRTHILSVGALINAAGSFHVHSLQDNYYMKEKNEQEKEKQVQKISGLDENEEKQGFIVEKFRSLLGLKSFHKRVSSKSNGDSDQFLTPSPSPSQNIEAEVEALAPAPAPTPSQVMHFHPHSYHQKHHFHWNHPPKKLHDDDRGRTKRILVAVFVSVGVAAFFVSLGLILFCRKKFTNHKKKKPKRTMPLCSSNTKGKTKGKVSLNPGLDLFYLDALGEDVEQHACSMTKTSDNNVSSSFTKEIVSVHEEVEMELVKNEHECVDGNVNNSSCVGDKIVHEDCDSSEDESFHSFVDSQSNTRLSNASAGSLSDTQSLLLSPQNSISNTNDSHQPPYSPKQKDKEIENETFVQCQQTSISSPPPPPPSPPPPPPPTPPLKMPLFTLHSLTTSSRVSSHSPLSLTSHTLSSPVNSETSSRSNLSPEKDSFSPSSSNPTKSPPPPPCPPPFPRGNSNKDAKTPPPPPYQFPQSPLGKDGTPLAKLKPLHWDKVRAAPNRTMVWDKLRSSSFE